jgi:hypothetical protein
MRFVNVPFLIKDFRADGITANSLRQRVKSASLTRDYYRTALEHRANMPIGTRLRLAASYFRFAAHAGDSAGASVSALPGARFAAIALPAGRLIAVFDRRKLGNA